MDEQGMQTPYDAIIEQLHRHIPASKIDLLPKKWEKIGDVLIIRLPKELEDYTTGIGKCYAEICHCKTVLDEQGSISGMFREPKTRVIYGIHDKITTHKEQGIFYKFIPEKIMFSSGNKDERNRMALLAHRDDIVVDLFAGIGYFSLPMAVYSKPQHIYSCEINPLAYRFLQENIVLNKAEHIITPLFGNNREVAPKDIADRVIMGYFHDTSKYLDVALTSLKNKKGIIHYHDTYPKDQMPDIALKDIEKAVQPYNKTIQLMKYVSVKSYAPGINHYVCDIRVDES